MEGLEYLIVVDLTLIAVVDDALESEVGLLPDEDICRIAMLHSWGGFKLLLDLGSGHQAVGVFVYLNIDNVSLSLLHPLLLFTEGTEEILHKTPFEESAILVDPCHFKAGELTHLGDRMLGGGYGALFLIKVDKHFNLVADVHIFGYVTLGKEDLAFFETWKRS